MSAEPGTRLRVSVLADVWATLDGVEALSSPSGGPLTRTIKRIIDPLVLRTAQHAELGRALVDATAAEAIADRILAERARLARTASWYLACRRARRELGITAGNPQDRYFAVAYELATMHGAPDDDAHDVATQAVAAAHASGTTQDAVTAYLADAARAEEVERALKSGWLASVEAGAAWRDVDVVRDAHAAIVGGDAAAWSRLTATAASVADALRHDGGETRLHEVVATASPAIESRGLAARLGLQVGAVTARPPVMGPHDAPVLERSVQRRAAAAARRGQVHDVAALVDDEVARATEPFGLFTPALHALLVLGIAAAPSLRPLEPASSDVALVRSLAAPLEREASVLHARRLTASVRASTPGIQDVLDELTRFERPLLRRLWARLHGMDQHVGGDLGPGDAVDLLSGVVRSTILDVRQKVRKGIETHEAGAIA